MPIPAPADTDNCPVEALRLETTDGVLAEIVIDCAPTPTLTIPAPETFSKLLAVPAELTVVFPSAVSETDEVWTLAEIVIVELA